MNKKKATGFITLFIFLVASLVLTGWTFDITPFISFTANMTAMNPLTAVCFLAISVWLFIQNRDVAGRGSRPIQLSIAVFISAVGIIKLCEYAHWHTVQIDQYLFADRLKNRFRHNAVAPTTALLFTVTGILLLNANKKSRISSAVHDVLIVGAFLLSYLGTIGYIYSLEPFYRIGPFVPMALNTSACFIATLYALFLVLGKGNIYSVLSANEMGGKLARKAIPFMLLIPPAFGYLRLILQRANFYNTEYGVALDTAFIVVVVLLLVYFYAKALNKNDLERKHAESEIIQNEEKYRSLIFALKEGVVYFDKNGTILFYNNSLCTVLGYEINELIGKNVVEVFSIEENKANTYKKLQDRVSGVGEDYETQLRHKDGHKVWVQVTARQIKVDGVPMAFFSTLTDITERKKNEEDIEAFSASAAHDLNAPLARIEMLADYLLAHSAVPFEGEDKEFMEGILKTSADLRMLLKDLLDFSRVGSEKIVKQPINMQDMVVEVVENNRHLNPSVSVRIEELPIAQGEPSAVKQVWTNLLSNAIKYSSKKEDALVIIGAAEMEGRQVYYVNDNGAGFDMADAYKLFAPFKRLHSDFEGNGLGLPIVKRIVEKHGGRIWAESEAGEGATFYFHL